MYIEILINGLSCAILCILFLKLPIIRNIFSSNKEFMTAYFALFIFMGINIAFLTRSNQINIFKGIKSQV